MKKVNKQPTKTKLRKPEPPVDAYGELLSGVVRLVEQARVGAARSINVVLTSTYWLVGQRIVEHEQLGSERAAYGQALVKRLALDLTAKLGRGFSERNLEQMRCILLSLAKSADAACGIHSCLNFADAVCEIWSVASLSLALVPLRPTAFGRRWSGPRLLRAGGLARRLVGPPTRPTNCHPRLPADTRKQIPLGKGRPASAPWSRPRSLHSRIPEPQRRVFGNGPRECAGPQP